MSTNFYWTKVQPWFIKNAKQIIYDIKTECENPIVHIGKRSAAGLYCSKCGCVSHRHGTQDVHNSGPDLSILLRRSYSSEKERQRAWEREKAIYDFVECPCCGESFLDAEGKHGENIISVCSFTWGLMKHKELIQELVRIGCKEKLIRDEYDCLMTPAEFWNEEFEPCCKIEFQCGACFS